MLEHLKSYRIILGSQSPRRQSLLKELGLRYDVLVLDVEEIFPGDLAAEKVPLYLAELKSEAYKEKLKENEIIITADTTVILDSKVINKPVDRDDALNMLRQLSGQKHTVVTGVVVLSKSKKTDFSEKTDVYFKPLTEEEINYYVNHYSPFDKAGSYGIQEWLGYIGIEKIDGCYYNVMGLPLSRLYKVLSAF